MVTTTTAKDEHHPINIPAIPFNFAPLASSSSNDYDINDDCFKFIFGCQRPGATNELSSYGAIKQSDVDEWVDYVKENGNIKRTLVSYILY
ncbi:MAG: hypothetical protein ACI90V_007584 [Bacillariaceae sp.]|jgi:hypothetical protein